MSKTVIVVMQILLLSVSLFAQQNALVNTFHSPFAKQIPVDANAVQWTDGFWGHWFEVSKDTMAINMLKIYQNDTLCHGFCNFEIAAGLKQGEHRGAPFHDGDFYKTLEAVISVYGQTKNQQLYEELEKSIEVIAGSQRDDGYIHTPTIIDHRNNPGSSMEFEDRMNFETYNMGHLMTAACLHHRITGQTNFLKVAEKATDFLVQYHENASAEQARNAICPSHYMGTVEMYRTTGKKKYLDLIQKMIDIRGLIENGTDHNQDRIPFRQQKTAVGHAVRANYLYAGVVDLYLETGEDSLMMTLESIWEDVVTKKLYITGACGALYDGVSPNGTTYKQSSIQQVHQAYGQAYQLPNISGHNETCANIGNVLWNYRMLLATGDSRFADILELSLYNSVVSGTDLKGTKFNYTNPLRVDHSLPYDLRWKKEREKYIAYSNCCPPNVVRTVAETHNYAYSLTNKGIALNLYGSSILKSKLIDGGNIKIRQETNYPWDGYIKLILEEVSSKSFDIDLRIPGWATDYNTITINGKKHDVDTKGGQYITLNRLWKNGDIIELNLTMDVKLMAANRLVEETRNQVAVKRGPIVYCLESVDMDEHSIFDILLPSDIDLNPVETEISGVTMIKLESNAFIEKKLKETSDLYFPINKESSLDESAISLIPYFAWANRGVSEMTVWIPVGR